MAAWTTLPDVRLTHPEKQLVESGLTKRDLVDYYRAVAEVILSQLADRPVTRIRFPDEALRRLERDGDLMVHRGLISASGAASR
jgi:DNA primase